MRCGRRQACQGLQNCSTGVSNKQGVGSKVQGAGGSRMLNTECGNERAARLHFSLRMMRLLGLGTLLLILRPLHLRPAAVLLLALMVRLPRSALSAQSGRAQGVCAGSVAAPAVVVASAAAGAAL